MSDEKRPLPGTNRQRAEESVSSARGQGTAEFVAPTGETLREWDFSTVTPAAVQLDPFWFEDHGYVHPCDKFSVLLCGRLRQRLEKAARLSGVTPDTMINLILIEVLGGGPS